LRTIFVTRFDCWSATPLHAPAGRKNGWVFTVARLKPGVTLGAAQANLATLSRQFEEQ
jgi:hypothetical protein